MWIFAVTQTAIYKLHVIVAAYCRIRCYFISCQSLYHHLGGGQWYVKSAILSKKIYICLWKVLSRHSDSLSLVLPPTLTGVQFWISFCISENLARTTCHPHYLSDHLGVLLISAFTFQWYLRRSAPSAGNTPFFLLRSLWCPIFSWVPGLEEDRKRGKEERCPQSLLLSLPSN